jgi:hypothetical protein
MLSWLWICLPSEYTPKGVQYLLVYRVSVTASILKKDLKRVLAEMRGRLAVVIPVSYGHGDFCFIRKGIC